MSAFKVDNGKAPEPETQRSIEKISLVVRAAVPNGSRHLLEFTTIDCRFLMKKVVLSANSAHMSAYLLQECEVCP
jgi:hypothetical protein